MRADYGRQAHRFHPRALLRDRFDHMLEPLAALRIVAVRYEHPFGVILHALLLGIALHQRLQRLLHTARLAHDLQLALVVNNEQRLNVQRAADHRHRAGYATALVQVVQVARHKAVADILCVLAQPLRVFGKGHTRLAVLRGGNGQHALPRRGG